MQASVSGKLAKRSADGSAYHAGAKLDLLGIRAGTAEPGNLCRSKKRRLGARLQLAAGRWELHLPDHRREIAMFTALIAALALSQAATSAPTAEAQVASVLDRLNQASSTADEATYFSLFAPDARFIGTDANEHWTCLLYTSPSPRD